MSFLREATREVRVATAISLPDGRKRLIRFVSYKANGEFQSDLSQALGTVDSFGTPPTGWENLRLIRAEVQDEGPQRNNNTAPVIILTYETVTTTLAQIDGPELTEMPDGRTKKLYRYHQLSSGTYTPGTVGTTTAPSDATCYLFNEQSVDNGLIRLVEREFQDAGVVRQVDESRNNGKLLVRIIESFKTVPTTPTGYTSVGTPVQNPNGYPIYQYSFFKGDGEVSRRTTYNQSLDQGTVGVTLVDITHLTASSVSTDPTSSPGAGYEKVFEDKDDRDGYRVWNITYAQGTGQVATRITTDRDGTREVTYVALGAKVTPSGIVVFDEERNADGYKIYTVTARQSASGGSVSTVSLEFERYVNFTYPGRAKRFSESYNSRTMMDVFKSPPITVPILATVTITYQNTNTVGTLPETLWAPDDWATMRAQWIGLGSEPNNLVQELAGYRSTDETALEVTAGSLAPNDLSIFGQVVFGSTEAKIIVTGGPAAPDTNTYVLGTPELEPAFTATDGTQWYRLTIITATIPSQPALPV